MATQTKSFGVTREVNTGPTWWEQNKPSSQAILVSAVAVGLLGWASMIVLSGLSVGHKLNVIPESPASWILLISALMVAAGLKIALH